MTSAVARQKGFESDTQRCHGDLPSGVQVTRSRPLEQRPVKTLGNPMARRAGVLVQVCTITCDLDKSLLLSGSQ